MPIIDKSLVITKTELILIKLEKSSDGNDYLEFENFFFFLNIFTTARIYYNEGYLNYFLYFS